MQDGKDATNRLEEYGSNSLTCSLPVADEYIVNQFLSIGFCLNVGMGNYPLTPESISAFSASRALPLSEWECDQLAMMSREYCGWLNKSKDRNFLSPWDHADYDPIEENRKRVNEQMKALRSARNN